MPSRAWKNIALDAIESSGLINLLQAFKRGTVPCLYVLAYHRVDEPGRLPWLDPTQISTTPEKFRAQMKLVAERYHPISAPALLEAVHGGQPLPPDAVLITVDDGYRDFQDTIFPICQHYGIQPLLFQPTAYVGTGTFGWDKVHQILHFSGQERLETPLGLIHLVSEETKGRTQRQLIQALKAMPYDQATQWIDTTHAALVHLPAEQQRHTLTWDELRRLSRAGVTIASHTHTHPILTRMPLEAARWQIRQSQDLLKRELGSAPPIFAFPEGRPLAYSPALIEMIAAEGFEIQFLSVEGRATLQRSRHGFTLPRLAVWPHQTLAQFHLRLTPLKSHALAAGSV